jgi:hypothetical protein
VEVIVKVYLSATYKDLVDHRKAAYHQLRMMRHDVIGMEDYVASDQRPLDKCLSDVAESDVYLGIFAWRYGFVPAKGNPEKQSITELEYRKAKALGKPCLIFLTQDDAAWPITMTDAHTGEGGGGAHIKRLRAELADEQVVSFFATADQLASRTAAAIFGVSNAAAISREHEPAPRAKRRAATGRAKPRPEYTKLWVPGSVLRVRFLDENPRFERAVRRYLPLWSAYGNVQFEFSPDEDAEVRVAFREGEGNWAFIGTDCMAVPLDQPTVNFSFMEPAEASVLHEFGHVLGLLHEHNHPKGLKWNKQSVYKAMSGPPNHWDKATTDANMFTKWAASSFPVPKPFDPESVMAYAMPKEWTGLDVEFGAKTSLSAADKEFVERLYPFG